MFIQSHLPLRQRPVQSIKDPAIRAFPPHEPFQEPRTFSTSQPQEPFQDPRMFHKNLSHVSTTGTFQEAVSLLGIQELQEHFLCRTVFRKQDSFSGTQELLLSTLKNFSLTDVFQKLKIGAYLPEEPFQELFIFQELKNVCISNTKSFSRFSGTQERVKEPDNFRHKKLFRN